MTHDRDCPLCRSTSKTAAKQYEGSAIGTCDRCGFLYVLNPESDTASESQTEIDQARHTTIPAPRRRHYYISNLIEQTVGKGAEVLEVGSGYGGLGKLLEKNQHTYLGFEPSDIRSKIASEGGLDVIDSIFDPSKVDQSFDAIVIDNVLEHVLNPTELITDAAEVVSDEGIVIVIVPSRYDLRRLHPGWNDDNFWIPAAHINFFRPTDLRRVYSKAGLRMIPFPCSSIEGKQSKDVLFKAKSLIDSTGYYPLSLYTYGTKAR
ncbi:class I SAM-dependent methyltransferase [Natrialba chahannaoensis]|uniref:class I SAM-dependent methyltransferase n=1 Tax=Natrialba chahannaoensis TaxID=68911 RepID=UPI000A060D2D|nr:class I SAM-dependent methyltransferase [Natrialba chahannaoensis]